LQYQGIQVKSGNGGGPIVLWNAGGPGAIIGVHTGGTGTFNYGCVFFDDKGMMDIFGADEFAFFMKY
jgi:hypothetical protein